MSTLRQRIGSIFALTAALVGLGGAAEAADRIKVGVTGGDGEIIWEQVKAAAAKEDLDIQIVVFNDYTTPNAALDIGDLDLNAFQHRQYLANQNKARGYRIVPIGDTVVAPIGLYSSRVKSIAELPEGAHIAIPNDPSNGGRALSLLQAQKLIALKPGAGISPGVIDILDNPRKLKFTELDAAQLPRSLGDVDAAVINTNYALPAGLNPRRDAIAQESSENNPYTNVIAAREKDRDAPAYRKIVAIYQTPEIKAFILKRFDGALIPAW